MQPKLPLIFLSYNDMCSSENRPLRFLGLGAAVLISLLQIGCGCMERNKLTKQLDATTAITIGYYVDGNRKKIRIEDKDKISEILSTVRIKSVNTDEFLKYGDINFVKVEMTDRTDVAFIFYEPKYLVRQGWGQIMLEDTSFYDLICDIVTKHEGRKIDINSKNVKEKA
jgi:hypothetical protein